MLLPATMLLAVLDFVGAATVQGLIERANAVSGSAVVHLNNATGPPQHLASGFIYGIPDTPSQIPAHFYKDIDFKYCRAGGAQLPGHGWTESLPAYQERFQSSLSNYRTTVGFGGKFILLPHDLWGADGTQPSSTVYPGDNGDWQNYDDFLTQVISDLKANNMVDNLIIDLWNEPDLSFFWGRDQEQWLQMWGRGYHRFKKDFPSAIISGPSLANAPSTRNTWWQNWAAFIAANCSAPSQWTWHMEGGGGDMESSTADFQDVLRAAGLPENVEININEYATRPEQVPSAGAWWIAQLERVGALGLRGNWASGYELHDLMAGLVGKPGVDTPEYNATGKGYWPAPEYPVYRYYAQEMSGMRVATETTADKFGDVYATVDDRATRLLVGARIATGAWEVVVQDLAAIGLPAEGKVEVRTLMFPGFSNLYQEVDAPTVLGTQLVSYTGGKLVLPVNQTDAKTAYAFEISR